MEGEETADDPLAVDIDKDVLIAGGGLRCRPLCARLPDTGSTNELL